jgi:HlyD family secretion protein
VKKKWILSIAVLVLAVAGTLLFLSVRSGSTPKASATNYEFAEVEKGKLETKVTSTGTLAPVSTVKVLSQMSGIAEKVSANYNDKVKKGQVLATLSTDMLKLDEKEAQANLDIALANYNLATLDYQNNLTLNKKGLVADYDLKSSKTTLDVKKATLASAKSALQVIETELNQYAKITSPIDGTIIERDIDVGQSVVIGTSSNATALFTIAGDLSKMEIKAEVDELDIASITVGQNVRFTVEADPSRTYSGAVSTIRLDPFTKDNVVYYYVIIKADNKDGSLLPGMTANVEFIKDSKESAVLVPNTALRYQPSALNAKEIARSEYASGLSDLSADQQKSALDAYDASLKSAASSSKSTSTGLSTVLSGGGGMPRPSSGKTSGTTTAASSSRKYLWYLDSQGKLAVRAVNVGISDGTHTEILGADDLVGQSVIVKEKVGQ